MYAYGVKVFHTAYSYNIACGVTHCLKFNFFPAENIFFNQYLCNGGGVKSCFGYYFKLLRAVRNAAAGAAQCKCGSHYNGIAYFICDLKRGIYIIRNVRGYGRLAYFFHCFLEKLTVLGFVNGFGVCTDKTDIVFFQKSVLVKLHSYGKSRLTA